MARAQMSLEDLLLRHGAVDRKQLQRAKDEQVKFGGELGEVLVELGYINEELLARALAHQLGIPHVNPEQKPPSEEFIGALPLQICEHYSVIALDGDLSMKTLRVATSEPGNADRLREIGEATGYSIQAASATPSSIEAAIRKCYYGEGRVGTARETEAPEIEPEPEDPDVAELRARVEKLEGMLSHPQIAAMLARLERLEQLAVEDGRTLRALSAVLVDLGFVSADELRERVKKA